MSTPRTRQAPVRVPAKATTATAVIPYEQQVPVLPFAEYGIASQDPDGLREAISDNLGGIEPGKVALSARDLPKVVLPLGGGLYFTVTTADGSEDVPAFDGVIVGAKVGRTLWPGPYTGDRSQPLCRSDNGVEGVGNPGGLCQICPEAQWIDTMKPACRLRYDVFVVTPGNGGIPTVVQLPPTSVGVYAKYMRTLIAKGGRSNHSVVTRFSLERAGGDGKPVFSRFVFTRVRDLDPEEQKVSRAFATGVKPFLGILSGSQAPAYNPDGSPVGSAAGSAAGVLTLRAVPAQPSFMDRLGTAESVTRPEDLPEDGLSPFDAAYVDPDDPEEPAAEEERPLA